MYPKVREFRFYFTLGTTQTTLIYSFVCLFLYQVFSFLDVKLLTVCFLCTKAVGEAKGSSSAANVTVVKTNREPHCECNDWELNSHQRQSEYMLWHAGLRQWDVC